MVSKSAIASGGRSRAIAAVQEMTQGGAESVLECVGSESAMATVERCNTTAYSIPSKPAHILSR
ncbi:MAG TPA: hypothetical protein V6C85_05070 [Allocoleopsis sp.]